MKGLNCYACFWSYPGLEKLQFNFLELKSSFLRPVSLPFSQREPFLCITVAGRSFSLLCRRFVSLLATVFSSMLASLMGGRFCCLRSPPSRAAESTTIFTGAFHVIRGGRLRFFGMDLQNHRPSRPLIFSRTFCIRRYRDNRKPHQKNPKKCRPGDRAHGR